MNFIKKNFKVLSNLALGLVIVITILSVISLRDIKFDYDFESFFPTDDPELAYYLEHRERFEYDNEFVLIGIENKQGVFREDFLQRIATVTDSLKVVPDVTSVTSPTNLDQLIVTELGPIKNPILHYDEPDRYGADSALIYQSPELVGSFFSKDAKSVSIYLKTTEGISKIKSDSLLERMNRILADGKFDAVHLASKINGQKTYLDKLQKEFIMFFAASFILVVAFLFISFRSFWGIWVPVLVVMLSILWTLGLMTATGKALDIMTVLLPTMMFVVGMSDVVHIVTKYLEELRNGRERFDALIKTIKEAGFATFITLLTTALGFLTLINSQIKPIRDFGIYTSLGVFVAFVLAYSIMPVVLNKIKLPNLQTEKETSRFWYTNLHRLLRWIFRRRKSVIIGTAIIVALSIFGITRIELNNFLIEGLTTRDQLRQDFNYFENNFSGVRPFEMAVTPADTTASLFDAPQLRAMDKLENYLTTQFGVGFVTSPVAVVKAANKAYNNGNPAFYKLPDSDEELVELTDALEPFRKRKEMKLIVTRDGKIGRFTGKMNDIGSQAFRAREEKFNQFLSSTPVMKNINVHMTGGAVMLDKNNQYLVDNTLQGLLISVLVVSLIIAIIHRNWRMIIIAIIPNMLPIVLIGGLMGFAGIELKSSTSIIFSIAFGIATDDTIHFLARLKLELAQGKSVFYAVKRTFLSTGKAVIVTSLILIAGFLTLIASGFESTFYFGLLVSITLLVAVLTDLLLFPVLVIWLLRKK